MFWFLITRCGRCRGGRDRGDSYDDYSPNATPRAAEADHATDSDYNSAPKSPHPTPNSSLASPTSNRSTRRVQELEDDLTAARDSLRRDTTTCPTCLTQPQARKPSSQNQDPSTRSVPPRMRVAAAVICTRSFTRPSADDRAKALDLLPTDRDIHAEQQLSPATAGSVRISEAVLKDRYQTKRVAVAEQIVDHSTRTRVDHRD
jgi:hypothetical protein